MKFLLAFRQKGYAVVYGFSGFSHVFQRQILT